MYHFESKRCSKEVEKLNDEMSRLSGYERAEIPDMNFVPLNVYFDKEKIN